MDRDRLHLMSEAELSQLARTEGIDVSMAQGRRELIALLRDALDDEPVRIASGGSSLTFMGQSKFSVPHSRSPQGPADGLPEYDLTGVSMLLRDSSWAFVFWGLSAALQGRLDHDSSFEGLILRVSETKDGASSSYDIPIQASDHTWYIFVPERLTEYGVQLVGRSGARQEVLAHSNPVRTPANAVHQTTDPAWTSPGTEQLIQYSYAEVAATTSVGHVPRRIMDRGH